MLHRSSVIVVFLFAVGLSLPAHADVPYFLVKVSCIQELNMFSVRTFMMWNICTDEDCSKLTTLNKAGIYELAKVHDNPKLLGQKCDLGFGKTAEINLLSYHEMSQHGVEHGIYSVSVNGQKVAELPTLTEDDNTSTENDLRITSWNLNKSPRIDVNLCRFPGMDPISIPESIECSFKEIADEGVPLPEKHGSYDLLKKP